MLRASANETHDAESTESFQSGEASPFGRNREGTPTVGPGTRASWAQRGLEVLDPDRLGAPGRSESHRRATHFLDMYEDRASGKRVHRVWVRPARAGMTIAGLIFLVSGIYVILGPQVGWPLVPRKR